MSAAAKAAATRILGEAHDKSSLKNFSFERARNTLLVRSIESAGSNGRVTFKDDELHLLVRAAREGDVTSYQIILEILYAAIERGEPIPKSLRDYALDLLALSYPRIITRHARKRGRPPHGYIRRNEVIHLAVLECERLGLNRTRSAATKNKETAESACSVVAAALRERCNLNMSEHAVLKAVLEAEKIQAEIGAVVERRVTYGLIALEK